jgi:RecA/RadA recombinase
MYGEFRTGKTQICHTMCVTSQLPLEVGGGNGKVVVIDTEGAFRLERLKPIAEHYGLDPQAVLENVVYCRVYNTDTQIKIISTDLPALLKESGPFRLIIIDSATSLFRVDFQGRGELAERQQKVIF